MIVQDEAAPVTNFERLLVHLKADSLAAKLLAARMHSDPGSAQAAMKKILVDRLEELRRQYGNPTDSKD
jgi:hypothetical protein